MQKNLVLAFDHREEIEQGKQGLYLGVSVHDDKKQQFWTRDDFSGTWRRAEISLAGLKGTTGGVMRVGLPLPRISLYGRTVDRVEARMSVWFDNIRIYTRTAQGGLSGKKYVSYANPPLFDWANRPQESQKVQYSQSPEFPEGATVTVQTDRAFHVPPKPLAPGKWYWRSWHSTDVLEGWSDIDELTIAERTHGFRPETIDFAGIAAAPHPRLKRMAMLDRSALSPSDHKRLLGRARWARRQGVPDHPGLFDKKNPDPRWPEWIDWYGKVADRITGSTGARLRRAGEAAVLTGDPEAMQIARELVLAGCKWDPEGGSSIRGGDLQSGAFLQGMCWCYDAAFNDLSPAERVRIRGILVQRAEQFYKYMSPFRGNAAQNHSWKKATVLAETALVLIGEHQEAEEWLDCAWHVYVYRFLPSMGFQGDNQEGIAYWSYGGNMIGRFGDLMRTVAGVDMYRHPWLAQTGRYPLYCAPPGGYAVCFADESPRGNHSIIGPYGTALVGKLGRRTSDPYMLWYAGGLAEGVDPKPPVDIPQSIHYEHIGWVIFNTCLASGRENVSVAMHSGPYYAGHQQADQNSFVINAYGDKLAIDGGYYDWWGSPHFKKYSVQTVAHNTLLVNGKGQAWRAKGGDGRVTGYYDSIGYGYTVGDASNPRIYGGVLKRFDRRILFIKPGFVVVHDLVESAGGPAKYDWLLHAHTRDPFPIEHRKNTFFIRRETAALRGCVLAPRRIDMRVSKSFDVLPMEKRASKYLPEDTVQPEWTLTVTPKTARERDEFLTAMQICRLAQGQAAGEAKFERIETGNAIGTRIKAGRAVHTVLFRRQAGVGPLKWRAMETDGQAAAVELDGSGNVKRAFAAAATYLKYRRRRLFTSREARDWSMSTVREPAAKALSGAFLDINGTKTPLQGYERRGPDGAVRVWWTQFEVPRSGKYRIDFQGWTGESPPYLKIDAEPVVLSGVPHSLRLNEGRRIVTVTGRGMLKGVTLTGRTTGKAVRAKMLPKGFKPAKRSLTIEAEKPSKEGRIRGRVMQKVGASEGKAHCVWDHNDQWAEWTFDVAESGHYVLLVRAAGLDDDIVREIYVDGKPLLSGGSPVRWGATGGWCRTADDWRCFRVLDKDGNTVRVRLDRGAHMLRMERIAGSSNIDQFLWEPASASLEK